MDENVLVKVDNVSKNFRLPHEKSTSVKGLVVNVFRRTRGYETFRALKEIDFEINKGDFFGIVGRNGGGKSTLLKILAGIYSPSQGKVSVNGKLVPFIELGVGFNPELTGRENVFLNGALLGFNRSEMTEMYDDIVAFAELSRFMDQKLKNYSSGMQVRLAFSIAIRAKGDILLLDEVLAVGDAAFQQKCYNYFEELRDLKKTVVFVSHDMTAVTRFCNKAIYLKEGKLVLSGTPSEIADYYTQENIQQQQVAGSSESSGPSNGEISAEISQQTANKVILEISFHTRIKDDVYIGMSVQNGGISFAEIITPENMELRKHGKVIYELNSGVLNAGAYQIGLGLYRLKNKELLAAAKNKIQFAIKGANTSRGGPLKLQNTWEKRG